MPFLPNQIKFVFSALYVKVSQDLKFYTLANELENLSDEERNMINAIRPSLKSVFNIMNESSRLSESFIKDKVIKTWDKLLLSEGIIYVTIDSLKNFYEKYSLWLNTISPVAMREGAVLRLYGGSEEAFYQQFYKVYANLQKALTNQLFNTFKQTPDHLEWIFIDMFKCWIIKWKDFDLFVETLSPETKAKMQRYYKLIRQ